MTSTSMTIMAATPIASSMGIHNSMASSGIVPHAQPLPGVSYTPGGTKENLNFCFCVPFRIIPGPEPEEIITSSVGAVGKWLHPLGSHGLPTHKLPIHQRNIEQLRRMCKELTENCDPIKATVIVSEPKPVKRKKRGLVAMVSLAGEPDLVYNTRGRIMQHLPVALRMEKVDIEKELFYASEGVIRPQLSKQFNDIAMFTGTDIFAMKPKVESASLTLALEINDTTQAERIRLQIYGDSESVEHAKTRVLIVIDDLLKQMIHSTFVNTSLIPLISGRGKKNIMLIESTTRTAIYFPPTFNGVYGYVPENCGGNRHADQIFITGQTREEILQAELRLTEISLALNLFMKSVTIGMLKADYIIMERLDEVKKIMEVNGTYVQLPPLGSAKGIMRVQGVEQMFVEKTIKQIMQITGQYYNASWWLMSDPTVSRPGQVRPPKDDQIHDMLCDICAFSAAEISYNKNGFEIHGSDDQVKLALEIANEVRFVKQGAYQIRVKIELANEHKEFVAGKKNGKINKIMGQSNVQVMFDGFNEYNFYICVVGSKYEPAMLGLELVEQELPAAVSFYVPDQYHKRIIGIQGAHIQRLMKKYSVYVKFLNPTERESGTGGWLDADLVGDNNVVIRTPARNAANLELVKREIMDTVQKVDAEIVTENVVIPRLFHRALIANFSKLSELEKKWSCSFIFPNNEDASDVVVVKGPEWQLPECINEFLALVPENHRIQLPGSQELEDLIKLDSFQHGVIRQIKEKFSIDVRFNDYNPEEIPDTRVVKVEFIYTRNNSGNLKDALDFMTTSIAKHGINSEPIKGGLPRPKSDTFEDSFPFFNSKVLQNAPPPMGVDEARRLSGEVTASMQATLGRMISDPEAAFHSGGSRPPGSSSSTASNSSHHAGFESYQQSRSQRQSVSSTGSGSAHSAHWLPSDIDDWGNADAPT